MMYQITTPYQDAVNMLIKVQMIDDVISYNCTKSLGDKYQSWIDEHRALIEDLTAMLEYDIDQKENMHAECDV